MRSNMTGVGYYNSEPRNFNRGFGRGGSKSSHQSQPQPSPQPPRKGGDIFMEAGRLAVDYLISRGLLSSNVLSGNYQNGSLKNISTELDDHRSSQERENSKGSSIDSREGTRPGLDKSEREGPLIEETCPRIAMEVESEASLKDTTSKDSDVGNPNQYPISDDVEKGRVVDDLDSKMDSLAQNKDNEEKVKPLDGTHFEEATIDVVDHDKEKDTTIMDDLAMHQGEDKSSDIISKGDSDPLLISEESNIGVNELDSLGTKNLNAVNDSQDIACSKTLDLSAFDHPLEEGRGEKRPIEEDFSSIERAKKAKQDWLSVAQSDGYSQLSDLSDKHSISPTKNDVNMFSVSSYQESFTSVPLPLKSGIESDSINPESEKQLISNSFKICDLNLMEASDIHENHGASLLYPTISGANRDILVDIDLSMRSNITNEYNASSSVGKDIDIIDLENVSLEGCKNSNTSMKNDEAGMTNIECFSNEQNTSQNQDGQDGYGYMISELLGNEVPNCTSVQPDMNSLHNDMGLNNPQGMFSEDDPIYMSLGEIPLSNMPDI